MTLSHGVAVLRGEGQQHHGDSGTVAGPGSRYFAETSRGQRGRPHGIGSADDTRKARSEKT